jgi:AraC family transcriptional regulator
MASASTSLHLQPAGLCDAQARVNHGISLHLGTPAAATCLDMPGMPRIHRRVGGMNIVPAGAQSRWDIEAPIEMLCLRLPTDTFAAVAQGMDLDPSGVLLQPHRQVHDDRISLVMRALHLERMEGMPHGTFLADSLENAICTRLLHAYTSRCALPRTAKARFSDEGLRKLLAHIDDHLEDSHLTLAELAMVAGTSASYLKQAFRNAVGRPVHRYVIERRLERAVAFLRQGMPISAAAASAGFAHASHLALWTRRLLRVTPQEIRARGKNPEDQARF